MALHPKFSSLLRVVLLVAAATAHHYSSTPPTAGSESEKALVERNAKASRKTFVGEKTSTDGKQEDEVAALPEPVLHDLQLQSSTRWTLRVVSWSRVSCVPFIQSATELARAVLYLGCYSSGRHNAYPLLFLYFKHFDRCPAYPHAFSRFSRQSYLLPTFQSIGFLATYLSPHSDVRCQRSKRYQRVPHP